MVRHTRQPGLRVDVPTLEPDSVMLERLSALSAASTPSAGRSRSVGLRVAFVATVVASLGATTWAAGALPGVDTPFRHRQIEHAALVPIPTAGDTGSPQSDVAPSGGPTSLGLPDHKPARPPSHHRGHHGKGHGTPATKSAPHGVPIHLPHGTHHAGSPYGPVGPMGHGPQGYHGQPVHPVHPVHPAYPGSHGPHAGPHFGQHGQDSAPGPYGPNPGTHAHHPHGPSGQQGSGHHGHAYGHGQRGHSRH